MKTTLQELIQEMEELKRTKLYPESFKAIDDCINLAYAKLEMEKQQIVDSFEKGYENGACVSDEDPIYHGGNCYNKNFKSE